MHRVLADRRRGDQRDDFRRRYGHVRRPRPAVLEGGARPARRAGTGAQQGPRQGRADDQREQGVPHESEWSIVQYLRSNSTNLLTKYV